MTSVDLIVYGHPAPQGSKRAWVNPKTQKAVMVEQTGKTLKPWRRAVKDAAALAIAGHAPLDGPLALTVTWTMPRPAKPKFWLPATPPDLSKLLRSTEDALTEAGLWVDDSRVVRATLQEVYVGQPEALDAPGAHIRVEVLTR